MKHGLEWNHSRGVSHSRNLPSCAGWHSAWVGLSATVAYRLSTLTLGPKHDVTFSSQLAINVSLTCLLILIVLVLTDRQSLGRPPPRPDSAVRSAAAVTLRATLRRASLSGTFLQTQNWSQYGPSERPVLFISSQLSTDAVRLRLRERFG